jgi:hypothetical protein
MNKKKTANLLLIAGLIALSALFYFLNYFLFKNLRDTVFYTIQDIAFLPLQVLLVSLILDGLLTRRQREDMLKKLNMVIGVFFGEVGTGLIQHFAHFDGNFEKVRGGLIVTAAWDEKAYARAKKEAGNIPFQIDSRSGNLNSLKDFLMANRDFLLGLMENPNLIENETFSQLLLAVFHVTDELSYRNELGKLSLADYEHLSLDIRRAYTILITEWLSYMNHLRKSFPYLYSLAVRMNPFNPEASPQIRNA